MNADSNHDACCCGHARRLHLYGDGMCQNCRRGCEEFHAVGAGHPTAEEAVGAAVGIIAVAGMAWAFWAAARGWTLNF